MHVFIPTAQCKKPKNQRYAGPISKGKETTSSERRGENRSGKREKESCEELNVEKISKFERDRGERGLGGRCRLIVAR